VAQDFIEAMEKDIYEIRVGKTQDIFASRLVLLRAQRPHPPRLQPGNNSDASH
jgi:hypothetical protein